MTPPAPTNATARDRIARIVCDFPWTLTADEAADAILAALPDLLVDEAAVERACEAYDSTGRAREENACEIAMRAALRAGVGL